MGEEAVADAKSQPEARPADEPAQSAQSESVPADAEQKSPEAEDKAVTAAQPAEEKATVSRQVASKWTKTSVLRQNPVIARHIPDTRMFSSDNLHSMLRAYSLVVLKPVVGTGGNGVMMVIRSGGRYIVRHKTSTSVYRSFAAMLAAVRKKCGRRSYLIQRGIRLATIRGRPIDYRVKVVKQGGSWKTRAMVGRLARPGLFVTNLCRGGTQLPSAVGIRRSLSASAVRRKKNEMRHLTRLCVEQMERHFPGVTQLGFDYGIDRSGKIWIFEVNTRPH